MSDKEFVVKADELHKLQEDASVSQAIRELASILTGRADDVPHRFRAPKALREFFNPEMVNQTYQYHTNIRSNTNIGQYDQQQILGTQNTQMPLILRMTTRPAQSILELEFDDANGSRLFTLEIEYGD